MPYERTVDRRLKQRFVMERELRYKVLSADGSLLTGSGTTSSISSRGIAFVANLDVEPGMFIELSISWPVLLEGACPLRFVAFGRVVRTGGERIVTTIEKHEFRTEAVRTIAARSSRLTRDDKVLRRWARTVERESVQGLACATG